MVPKAASDNFESSDIGSEVVTMRTCLELVKELCYKMRIMGVPIDGPAILFEKNKILVNGA